MLPQIFLLSMFSVFEVNILFEVVSMLWWWVLSWG